MGKRSRHMNIRYLFIKDKIKASELSIEHCGTDVMVADSFTKPLQGAKFCKFRKLIMNKVNCENDEELEEENQIDK